MQAPSWAEALLDRARSETKLWGGDEPTLTHAAWVLAEHWEDEFNQVFGEQAKPVIKQLLTQQRFIGTAAELRELLERSDDVVAAAKALREKLQPALQAVESGEDLPAPEAQSADPDAEAPAAAPAEGAAEAAPAEAEETGGLPKEIADIVELVTPAEGELLRPAEAAEIAAQALRSIPTIPALIGKTGVGKTSLLHEVAAKLAALPEPVPMWRIGTDTIIANPYASLRRVLEQVKQPTVVVVDDLDGLANIATHHPDVDFLSQIITTKAHEFARVVVVLNAQYAPKVDIISQAFGDALTRIAVPQLPPAQVDRIVREAAAKLAAQHDLELAEETITAALAPPLQTEHAAHPGLAIARLDVACARAYVSRVPSVGVEQLASADEQDTIELAAENLVAVLKDRVKGQDEAIEKVAKRLTLTRAHLDLRPDRPNGVFLFIGPTGVGKTQLAREIAAAEFGGEDRLIRLDMSEFAQEWSLSRIAGPMPGFVGSDEPEQWLTTKVAAMPRSVVLLDEIEKAHPRVWNLFLQVFDSGRLTDSRGSTADFSETVIVMTSNMGVRDALQSNVGFGHTDKKVDAAKLVSAVKEQMAPELLNRMDDIIVFNSLGLDAIEEIANYELNTQRSRLSAAGWTIAWTGEVPKWLANNGYDPAFGARHLQRNIEKEFLMLLTTAESRRVTFDVADNSLVLDQ
ncbi:MAG: AAA family ATPase [Propionibacteriaceae bacterium]|jgi:ATP-dependent Clp protease ATP-binding subunit ClpA|nr:AAA family ATPase [Propionibacteriaceae bacterium]